MHGDPTLRSPFVTRVAWAFILLSAFGAAISLVQTFLSFAGFAPSESLPASSASSDWSTRGTFIALFALFALTLFVSVALLRRRWWARRAFLAITASALAYHLVALLLGRLSTQPLPSEGPADYLFVLRVVQVVGLAYPIVASGLLVWILIKLQTPAVRAEFSRE